MSPEEWVQSLSPLQVVGLCFGVVAVITTFAAFFVWFTGGKGYP